MKPAWVAFALLLLSTPGAFAACGRAPVDIADHGSSYRRKYDTLAHRLLDDERPTGRVRPQMYAILDAIIDQARASLPPYPAHPSPEESVAYGEKALPEIDCILLADGFAWRNKDVRLLSDMLTLTHVADIQEILSHDAARDDRLAMRAARNYYIADCDTGALIYIAVAEAMHLPLALVPLPEHVFVRWTADAKHRFDYETTAGHVEKPLADGSIDWAYASYLPKNDAAARNRRYLADMTPDQYRAMHFYFLGATLRMQQRGRSDPDFSSMLDAFQSAIRLDPAMDVPYNDIAWYYSAVHPEKRMRRLALRYALRASALHSDPAYDDTLACAYAALGDFVKAAATEPDPAKAAAAGEDEYGMAAIRKDAIDIARRRSCSESVETYTGYP